MATGSLLSPEQTATLQSVLTFLKGVTVYLEAALPCVLPEDEAHVRSLLDHGALCTSKLAKNFPDLAEWQKQKAG